MTLAARLARAIARVPDTPAIWSDAEPTPAAVPPVPAAVLVAVTDRPEPGLILTVRHEGLRNHPGQIAFPGGRIDPGDADAAAAALREAEEEVALPAAAATVVGLLDPIETISSYRVIPVLAVVPPDLPLAPRAGEVAAWFEPPLAHLLDPAHRRGHEGAFRGRPRRLYEIEWAGRRIWGATAAMIVNLARRLGPAW